jgi:hypothetical protein
MDMFLLLVSSICLLGVIAFTIMIELENIKRNKRAKEKSWEGWSLEDPK